MLGIDGTLPAFRMVGFFIAYFPFLFFSVFTDYAYGMCHSHHQLPAFQVVVYIYITIFISINSQKQMCDSEGVGFSILYVLLTLCF